MNKYRNLCLILSRWVSINWSLDSFLKKVTELSSLQEQWTEAQQERLELQRARVLEVNRHLAALITSWERGGLPLHMNLAFLSTPTPAQLHQDMLSRLKQQNHRLTEVSIVIIFRKVLNIIVFVAIKLLVDVLVKLLVRKLMGQLVNEWVELFEQLVDVLVVALVLTSISPTTQSTGSTGGE